jgi:hypothetical protein
MMIGTSDLNVHFPQVMKMADALNKADKPYSSSSSPSTITACKSCPTGAKPSGDI